MLSGIWMGITSLFGGGLSFMVKLMARHLSLSEPSLINYNVPEGGTKQSLCNCTTDRYFYKL